MKKDNPQTAPLFITDPQFTALDGFPMLSHPETHLTLPVFRGVILRVEVQGCTCAATCSPQSSVRTLLAHEPNTQAVPRS